MINWLPELDDKMNYYIFVPMLATLYGRDDPPYRFLRVIDAPAGSESIRFVTGPFEDIPGDPDTLCVVETCDIKTFTTFLSFGYTPYIECAFSRYKSGISFDDMKDYVLSQSALRNYEKRAQQLLALCNEKRYSMSGFTMSNDITKEMVDELRGVLAMWEMLMNTGNLLPKNCLEHVSTKDTLMIPIKQLQEKFDELDYRLLVGNFSGDLKFKITQKRRNKLMQVCS